MAALKYFSYCPEQGFELFETEEEAQHCAEENLQIHRDEAGEGWHDEVSDVCWGEVKQSAVAGKENPTVNQFFDYIVDYNLKSANKTEVIINAANNRQQESKNG